MRLTASAGLFALTIFIAANSQTVHAQSMNLTNIEENIHIAALDTNRANHIKKINKKTPTIKTVEYTIMPGDTLSKIAQAHKTTWKRIYNKNNKISHPDVINPGDKLIIPNKNEKLAERPLPANNSIGANIDPDGLFSNTGYQTRGYSGTPASSGSASGNRYTPGYCTWYAKNMRPDLPNNLGNANSWVYNASAQGIPTGSAPRPGAIGQQGMHVVYVQNVNPDGTVAISEMNYQGLFTVSSRIVPASTFQYIY